MTLGCIVATLGIVPASNAQNPTAKIPVFVVTDSSLPSVVIGPAHVSATPCRC
ncbi:MAG TPA: hypothetical protein VMT85_12320 [Thermoanaerobaculia bacterium]|nr:hypothetical protein [Thermoanaerobaculia bacterium]